MSTSAEKPDVQCAIDVERAANVYSLLQALEHLEQAFISGEVTNRDYNDECTELLSLCHIMEEATPNVFLDLTEQYKIKCPLALNRLKKGTPATSSSMQTSGKKNETYLMFELSEQFITLVDALKLGCALVEELFPLVHDLMATLQCLEKVLEGTERDVGVAPAIEKLGKWQSRLNAMAAYDKLEETDRRQLAMDTETLYASLKTSLRMNG
ncbi:vacuolar sorting-associated protein 28-2 [Babesia ovis]|uniref:Vacuolar sorting-associated protein 28-2 n=1 Tax=Babesia ovis TaxID=5869 RepID=A0A9W5WUS3_BABOV|nr:vacuolar sorting-associated protein 28-2 [Babesia ovis]